MATALFGFGAGGVAATLADAPTLIAVMADSHWPPFSLSSLAAPFSLISLSNKIIRTSDEIHTPDFWVRVTLTISAEGWGEVSFVDTRQYTVRFTVRFTVSRTGPQL
ncbi:hypothetical protein QM716_28085 [Rhodococcus sp. IEGM 1409]|uniref:hypothetical protein n=1 Tax=Rhodococcus sp. IEGM 1409 TaxID=3047082 RepID=UPI0024B73792|nr:hypothetical protein [Rhodococcus sp. IEGM 1409]MDI9903729.1 hypothetical protein [Rhodococcus sp. IEGM 1409]